MEEIEDRQLQITGTFSAPINLIWEVWTKPEHIANWWGPNGFTNSIDTMDFREDGEWKFAMHGPDGTNYPNRSIFREIVPFQKIVFEHFNPHFITTAVFQSQGAQTNLIWSMLFDTPEMFDIIVRVHKADEGQKQNLEKLADYVTRIQEKH